jgi:hypothetical protein
MARTAVVAGTATAVVGGVSRHQQSKAQTAADAEAYQQQEAAAAQQAAIDQGVQEAMAAQQAQQAAAPPPPPPAAPATDTVSQLKELAALKEQGILTDAEFEAQKAKLLGS